MAMTKPARGDLLGLFDLSLEHVLPIHSLPVIATPERATGPPSSGPPAKHPHPPLPMASEGATEAKARPRFVDHRGEGDRNTTRPAVGRDRLAGGGHRRNLMVGGERITGEER